MLETTRKLAGVALGIKRILEKYQGELKPKRILLLFWPTHIETEFDKITMTEFEDNF